MPTQIITKNSATPSSVPTTGDLTTQGEMAVNVVDKRLFVRDNSTGIQEVGTNPTSLTCSGTANFTATFQLNGVAVTATAAELNKLDGTTAVTADFDKLAAVTASAAELNYVDGVTSSIQTQLDTKAPLASPTFTGTTNITGTFQIGGVSVTATATELNKLDGVTSSTAELNILDGVTATTAELNKLAGTPAGLTSTELGYVDGVTSSIQTQLNSMLPRNSLTEVITGTTDTLTDAEEGYDLVYTSSSSITVTLHSTAPVGFQCTITKAGTGPLNIVRSSTDTINGDTAVEVANQWSTVYVLHYEEGKWLVAGDLL